MYLELYMVANISLSRWGETTSISKQKLELNIRKNEHKHQTKWKVVIKECNERLLEISEEGTQALLSLSVEVYTYLPEETSH